jgi:galactarate dehydratase
MDIIDNVAIAANLGGLKAGSVLASGLILRKAVPQSREVALKDSAPRISIYLLGYLFSYLLSYLLSDVVFDRS